MNPSDMNTESSHVVPITAEGMKSLQAELDRLSGPMRSEIAERIRESQQHGEFSEDNSELDQVKNEQAYIENRIAELRVILSNAVILEEAMVPTDRVGIGSIVNIEDIEFGDSFEVRVVSSVEADPSREYLSDESPMGQALMGREKGESISFHTPDGVKRIKILGISK